MTGERSFYQGPSLYDQRRFPLATLVLCALARHDEQQLRLLALATREARTRGHSL